MNPDFRPRPCKFGADCRKFQQGQCTFGHDNNGGSVSQYTQQGGRGGWTDRGGRGSNNNDNNNIPDRYHNQGGMGGQGRGGNSHFGGQGGSQGYRPPKQPYQPNNPQDITQQLCRFFQLGDCNKGEACRKPHTFTKNDSLRRVIRVKQVPSHDSSRLCLLNIQGSDFFVLKQGNQLSILQYNSELGQFSEVGQKIVLEYPEIHFFDAQEKFIFFAYENKNTSYTNIGLIDSLTGIRVTVDNAHKLKVTGIVQIFDNNNVPMVLSSSLDGTIKVWRIEGDKLVLNKELSQAIGNLFKTQNNFQVLFLKKQIISGKQVLAAGTSDNRLLFWIGSELTFQSVSFEETYSKVLVLKYVQTGGNWVAITIVWDAQNSVSALVAINLLSMQSQVVLRQDASKSPRLLFSNLATVGSLLLVSNIAGLVSIFKVPDFGSKIGCIHHFNSVADMLSTTSLTSTNIQMINLFVLQKKQAEKPGSLSVYSLRE